VCEDISPCFYICPSPPDFCKEESTFKKGGNIQQLKIILKTVFFYLE
jgi:hypothetical protein